MPFAGQILWIFRGIWKVAESSH